MLFLCRSEIEIFRIDWPRGCRRERSETLMFIVQFIYYEARRYDVVRVDIRLDFSDVAHPPDRVLVLVVWQFGDDDVVVFSLDAVEKPDFSFFDRPRKSESRVNFIEGPSFFILQGWKEVGGDETEVIVAVTGIDG